MSISDLSQCITDLNSSKIMLRKKSSNQLSLLLEDEKIIRILNEKKIKVCSWTNLLNSVHEFLYLEALRLAEDEQKGKKSMTYASYTQRNLLTMVVRKASLGNEQRLVGHKLLKCILKSFTSVELQKYFGDSYINILKEHFLNNSHYVGSVPPIYWTELLHHLKNLYSKSKEDTKIFKCLQLTLQNGLLFGLPANEIRQLFSFVTEVAHQQFADSTKKLSFEITLNMLLDFCTQTAKDCRLSCCKLGEEVIEKIINILETDTYENTKILIYKFLLLQIKLHHPKGSSERDTCAYACDWQKWKRNLKYLYSAIVRKIDGYIIKHQVQLTYRRKQIQFHSLDKHLLALGIEVYKQVCHVNFNSTQMSTTSSFEPSTKRAKVDFTIDSIISSIQETKDWPWIEFISSVLDDCPTLIASHQYIMLLQTLSTLQAQCKDKNVQHHLYKCLCVLIKIQDQVDDLKDLYQNKLHSLWMVVWDMAHRTAGLNQNIKYTHKLIQSLIQLENKLPFANLFNTYHSGVLLLSKHSLESLDVLCNRFIIPKNLSINSAFQKCILRWILNVDNNETCHVFSEKITAKVIVSLIFKVWPKSTTYFIEEEKSVELLCFCDIEEMHCITSLQESLWTQKKQNEEAYDYETKYFQKNDGLLEELIELIKEYSLQFLDDESNANFEKILLPLLNFIILITNVLSELVEYNVITENDLPEHRLTYKLMEMLNLLHIIFKKYKINMKIPEGDNINIFKSISKLFCVNAQETVLRTMFNLFPKEIIKILFDNVNSDDADKNEDDSRSDFDVLQACQQALCDYFSNSHLSALNNTQLKALETFLDYPYEFELSQDYNLAIMVLESLTKCKIGAISENTLESAYTCFSNICKIYYRNNESAVTLLKLWYDFYPHTIDSKSEELKVSAAEILKPFFNCYTNYGPSVCVKLVNCLGLVIKWDISFAWLNDDTCVAHNMLNFLKHDYQEVRIAAIKNLMILFDDRGPSVQNIQHQQEVCFTIINRQVNEVFIVDETLLTNSDRKIDEEVSRTMTALLTFCTVIVSSTVCRKRALFSLLKLTYSRKIDATHLRNALNLVSYFFNSNNVYSFLKPYVDYLILNWSKDGMDIQKFPYGLLECKNVKEFNENFLKNMGHVFLQHKQTDILNNISQHAGIAVNNIIKECLPNIVINYLFSVITSTNVTCSEIYEHVMEQFGSEIIINTVIDYLHVIIGNIIGYAHDEPYLRNEFNVISLLPEPNEPFYSLNVLLKVLNLLEVKFLSSESFVSFCSKKFPSKLQMILLQRRTCIHFAPYTEDKILEFFKFTVYVNILLDHLSEIEDLKEYIIKEVCYTLLHLINFNESGDSLKIFVCKYFRKTISKIITNNHEHLQELLPSIIGTMVIHSTTRNEKLSEECIKLLHTVISHFQEDIKILDPLPDNVEKFKCLLPIYNKIEQRIKRCSLKENIQDFLLISKENNICIQGIVQLRRQILEKRKELEDLYEEAQLLRGFSEDYEHNALHRLVYVLVRLCASHNNDANVEAARCLGELGPANLAIVTLDIQKKYKDVFEPYSVYVAGSALSLLSQYLFDKDIKIVRATCTALYEILASKDGEKALAYDREFVNNEKINRRYFQPFVSISKAKDLSKCIVNISSFKMLIDRDDLWCPTDSYFSKWILDLIYALINSFEKCYFQQLLPLCKVKIEFAQNMFPLLVVFILNFSKDVFIDVLSSQIRKFFEKHWTHTLKENYDKNDIVLNQDAIKCLLEVVHLIELQKYNINKKKPNQDLELNYLHIAKAANYCSFYFSALQFIEFWSHKRLSEISKNQQIVQYSNDTPLYTIITYEESEIQKIVQNILKESFNKIGDHNALSYITFNLEDFEIFEQMQKWDQVALQYDIKMSHSDSSFNLLPDLTRALKKSSLMQIPLLCRNDQNQQYECAWRLNDWSISESDKMDEKTVIDFNKEHYLALKALHEKDNNSLDKYLNRARKILIEELKKLNLVTCKSIYDILTRLRCLEELEDFGKKNINSWKSSKEDLVDFEYFELIQAQRIILLKDEISSGRSDLKNVVSDFNLKLAEYARKEGYENVSKRALSELKYIQGLDLITKYQIALEDVRLWWYKDKSTAMSRLRSLLNVTSEYPRLHSDALKLYGTWMIESNSVASEYLLKSIDELKKIDYNHENLFEIYDILGRHCDFKYQQVVAYIKSSEFEQKIKNMEKCRVTVSLIQQKLQKKNITQDENRTLTLYKKQSDIDEDEIQSTYKERENFLEMALRYYLQNLEKSKSNDLRMFRLLSLWLENRNSDIINRITSKFLKIPTYKYIPILPQLVPHLNPNDDNFSTLVFQIVERCAKDHPHHTIPLVLALANASQDKIYQQKEKKEDTDSLRIKGAQKLLQKLKNSSIGSLVTKMELVSASLIELAYLNASSCINVGKNFSIKSSCRIRRIKNFEDVMVPTYKLPISKCNDYSNIIGIVSFSDVFTNVGGINAPKKISCMGTDGITRHMLVKGKDDLRQDAVMQQVFDIMNEFLTSNKKTFKQRLRIKTYKVVPLSQRSGVLHWVENSVPLGNYLIGDEDKQGAHRRYNKDDYSVSKCRKDIDNAAKTKLSNADKLKIFLNICEHFRPIFFKFFEEYFPEPSTWYEKRQAYTHSVATTSMCGYILGIGDRHVQNILINEKTAEVIHIDFGIAFEQGKVLPTPETVPFRLTRDIVSGMGICGIEGVFRKSCENTMEVLRNNSETIVAILEVLLYDPLYAWSITPSQAYSRQFSRDVELEKSHHNTKESSPNSDNSASLNIMAERVLWRLRQKLKGTEEGSATSVEDQVEKLIQQARDPANLSRLFSGWQAYL